MKYSYKTIFLMAAMAALSALMIFSSLSIGEDMEIFDKTLRFHILANSDREEDQRLKLKVRDAVLNGISDKLNACESKAEAEELILREKNNIESIADRVIAECGMDYKATLTLTVEEYPERAYEGISLPAGEYTSVRILLGEAEGQNWWCVLFPQVCTDTATPADEKLAQVGFTPNQIRLLTEQEKPVYRFKFKIVELISELIK